jgi:hypothetical protein
LGVTPSAWASNKAIQVGSGSLSNYTNASTNNQTFVTNNAYYNAGWKYIYGDIAAMYEQKYQGGHAWHIAASGTAGSGISFTQAMTLDASGNLGVGTTSPDASTRLDIQATNARVRVKATSTGSALYTTNNTGGTFYTGLDDSGGNTFGVGAYSGVVWNGANTPIVFATNNTERARIDSSGNLLVGTTSAFSGSGISPKVTISNSAGIGLIGIGNSDSGMVTQPAANTNYYAGFFLNSSSTGVGNIFCTGSGTTYNTTSDQRLKENIQDADSASSLIDSLQVRKFDWKTDQTHQRYGFIAQELVTVAPEAVHQPTDTEQMMAVDYSKLVPMLVKEIQSLRQRLSAANL